MQPSAPAGILVATVAKSGANAANINPGSTILMNNIGDDFSKGESSMRRTLLTLLAAVAAFGVLTASYATADLPEAASASEVETVAH
ncbi:hypothetical protein [Consotaella salsifontis]|uniref:Uncharacterized protein n=1 Tax=Consotaella salsifontis TaxID=1365950 RepID=A0A1T4R5W0_9HYPH|nr:hypothetical protein [Consotaella salsifontis]SKA11287.1 hypothetical protein SAMN05428963_10644 [Consotaella salsifontis]